MVGFQYQEEKFLKTVKNGNCQELEEILRENPHLNINCSDFKGYHALDIAVLRKDQEAVSKLLARQDISVDHINSAISKLIKANTTEMLDTLLDFLDSRFAESIYEDVRDINSSAPCNNKKELILVPPSAPPLPRSKSRDTLKEITKSKQNDDSEELPLGPLFKCNPMITAALCDNAEVIHLLYRRGYRIDKPHHPNCKCCWDQSGRRETLSEAIHRLNIYTALASSTYILLTSNDPVLTAFELCEELKVLAKIYAEYKENYKRLENQCSKFASKMLDLCQDTAEVETILSQKEGTKDPRLRRFTRLHLAMNYEQKEFVAHPNCQQVLRSLWAEGLPNWWIWSPYRRLFHVLQHMLFTQVMMFGFVFLPVTYVKKNIAVPLHRFIYASTCYIIFLGLLLWSLIFSYTNDFKMDWKDLAITVWVIGHFWEIMVNIKLLGIKVCFRRWWLICDLLMYSIFVIVQGIRIYGHFALDFVKGEEYFKTRNIIEMTDAFFAFASMIAFYRILFWYQSHPTLGTLERTLQYMIKDVTRFFALMIVAIGSFAVGLNYIYRKYDKKQFSNDYYQKEVTDFSSLYKSVVTLFWAMLGKGGTNILTEEKPTNVTINNATSFNVTILVKSYEVNNIVGHWIWAFYHIMTGVVLLNMLIAMLADSFNRVQNDADTEWKFCRADLWLSYFDRQSTLPPPFNVFPTLMELPQTIRNCKNWFKNTKKTGTNCWTCYNNSTNDRTLSKQEKDHKDLVAQMVQRYLQAEETLKTLKNIPVTHLDRRLDDTTVKFRSEIYADIRNLN